MTRRYAVFGAGMMGRVVAKDLIGSEPDAHVTLLDFSEELLGKASAAIGSDRLRVARVDAKDREATKRAMAGHDAAVGALPHALSLPLVEAAVASGTSLVDLVGEASQMRRALDGEARANGAIIVPGCGVAPGISNFCVGRGMELLDETHRAVIYVGGIPREPRPPLYYETVYLLESVLGVYQRPATIRLGGEHVEVEALSGLEELEFPEPVGVLEAFYTDGLGSLPITVGDRVQGDFYEKTLRYPGHAAAIQLLRACGLFERRPIDVGGASVPPVVLLQKVLEERLKLGPAGDILVLKVLVQGQKDGERRVHTFELIDFFDPATGNTAMARTTGFTAACAARSIASGSITTRGVLFPEEIFLGDRFAAIVSELEKKGVTITHSEAGLSDV